MGTKVKEKDARVSEWQGLNVTGQGDAEVEDIKMCIGSSGMSCSDGGKETSGISCRS